MDTHVTENTGIGHNSGQASVNPIDDAFSPIKKRIFELEAGATRVPDQITVDTADKVTDFIKQCKSAIKDAGDVKAELKRPHLDANTKIENTYKDLIARLSDKVDTITKRLNTYERERREAEQRRIAEEQRIAREKAEAEERRAAEARRKAEEEAQQARSEEERARAQEAIAEAHQAQEQSNAAALAAELAEKQKVGLTRGQGSSLVTTSRWDVTVDMETVNLNRLRKWLDPDAVKRAARAAMKEHTQGDTCTLDIQGVTVERVTSSHVR